MKKVISRIFGGTPPPAKSGYAPRLLEQCDHELLLAQAAEFYGLPPQETRRLFANYGRIHRAEGYAERFGERKTLNFEESFLIYTALATVRPKNIVEIGTQYGQSTRRILDMAKALNLEARVTCFDIENQVKQFAPEEAELRVHDLTGNFSNTVLRGIRPEFIYLDAHPYALLREVIGGVLGESDFCTMAVHDCSPGLYNPNMTVPRSDPNVTSANGVWERYALAEEFGIADPGGPGLDHAAARNHRMRIFETTHGLAVIRPLAGRDSASHGR